MHEFALVEQLVSLLEESATEKDIKEIQSVTVVVGLGSTFVPSVIEFLFKAMATEPPFTEETELVLVEQPLRVKCTTCGSEYEHEDWRWTCASCGSTTLRQVSGNTVYIESYEGA